MFRYERTVNHHWTIALISSGPAKQSSFGGNLNYQNIIIMELIKNTCCTCGTQYPTDKPIPELCPICSDDRQYFVDEGQTWTNTTELLTDHKTCIKELNSSLYELRVNPLFALGQRALLLLSPGGNILWDCVPVLDQDAIDFIRSKGGIKVIAFSHPHFYSNVNHWAETFDATVYIHRNDEQWVFNRGKNIRFWAGESKPLWDGISIENIGGHFPGSSVLRVPTLAEQGSLFTGDTLYVSKNKKHIAMMYSYPNYIPLPADELNRVIKRVNKLNFDAIYGGFEWQNMLTDAKNIFTASIARYPVAAETMQAF
jgi:glyoxylase-like metal-dependent hydrolase (beta-lactamase superfamily II)